MPLSGHRERLCARHADKVETFDGFDGDHARLAPQMLAHASRNWRKGISRLGLRERGIDGKFTWEVVAEEYRAPREKATGPRPFFEPGPTTDDDAEEI